MINIAAQIPPRAKRVVELGCLREKAGEAFLRIQPKAEYWGITSEAEELREVGRGLSHVAYALPEELDFEKLGIYEADAIIIRGDYFRGLTAQRLKKWAEVLSENGQLLLDVPNPAYIRKYLEVLAGREAGTASGLEAAKVKELLKEAGLHMISAQGIYDAEHDVPLRQGEESKALLKSLASLLDKMGSRPSREKDPWLQRFFFRAVKKPVEQQEKIMVQTIVGETVVTPRLRIYLPNAFLSTEAAVTTKAVGRDHPFGEQVPPDIGSKVLIRHRLTYQSFEQGFGVLNGLREGGHLIVAEMDDNPRHFTTEKNEALQSLTYLGTHCIQVSTEPLAEIMRQYNPHVQVFPNQLQELPEKRNYLVEKLQRLKEGEDYVTFFFGALNRTHEWQEVMPVITEAVEKYGSKLRFKVLSDRGFYEALPTKYKEFIGSKDMYGGQFVPYHVYAETLHASDISFLPLRDNDFNRAKSDLKFIESAAHGAVALASPTVYESTIKEGRNGFIYRTPREFKEYLTLLIEDRERRFETAEAAYRYVRDERLLANHYLERLAWYREMVARRPELDRELVKRVNDWLKARGMKGKGAGK